MAENKWVTVVISYNPILKRVMTPFITSTGPPSRPPNTSSSSVFDRYPFLGSSHAEPQFGRLTD